MAFIDCTRNRQGHKAQLDRWKTRDDDLVIRTPIQQSNKDRREIERLASKDMDVCVISLAERYLNEHPKPGIVWYYYASSLGGMARYDEALLALHRFKPWVPTEKLFTGYPPKSPTGMGGERLGIYSGHAANVVENARGANG